jgi:uncharacterized membrane protein
LPDAEAAAARSAARSHWPGLAATALGLLLVATTILRFTLHADRPLWLDEVWTGMIVTRHSFADFFRECRLDANAPLYSILAAAWAQVSGVSDRALRFLPEVLGCAAPVIAVLPRDGVDRATRLTWCGLLACWIPGIWYSGEARPYTLALALAVANTAAYVELLRKPGHRTAWIWTSLSSLAILTHYFGAVLVCIQGLVYLFVHKTRAVRTWPAALAFVPAFAALAVQAQGLIGFTSEQHAWIQKARPLSVVGYLQFLLDPLTLLGTSLWFIAVIAIGRALRAEVPDTQDDQRESWIAAACAVAAVVVTIGLGFWRPMVIPRYFIEFAPGVLFGIALAAVRFSSEMRFAPAVLVGIFAVSLGVSVKDTGSGNSFSWEQASTDLMATRPTRLVFMWDTPLGGTPKTIEGVGGFFFERAGRHVVVDPVIDVTGQDPNALLLEHAKPPGSVIIWIYDNGVPHTLASQFPPRIDTLDPRWRCRNYVTAWLGVIGCSR